MSHPSPPNRCSVVPQFGSTMQLRGRLPVHSLFSGLFFLIITFTMASHHNRGGFSGRSDVAVRLLCTFCSPCNGSQRFEDLPPRIRKQLLEDAMALRTPGTPAEGGAAAGKTPGGAYETSHRGVPTSIGHATVKSFMCRHSVRFFCALFSLIVLLISRAVLSSREKV